MKFRVGYDQLGIPTIGTSSKNWKSRCFFSCKIFRAIFKYFSRLLVKNVDLVDLVACPLSKLKSKIISSFRNDLLRDWNHATKVYGLNLKAVGPERIRSWKLLWQLLECLGWELTEKEWNGWIPVKKPKLFPKWLSTFGFWQCNFN